MSPGPIATPMGARELDGPSRDVKLKLMRQLPIAREGTMVGAADAIGFLASDRASYITGTDLLAAGGNAAAPRPARGGQTGTPAPGHAGDGPRAGLLGRDPSATAPRA